MQGKGAPPSSGGSDSVTWFSSASPERVSRSYGGNVYRVEPTGSFTDNFDNPGTGQEFESGHPLRILGKWGA